MKNKFKLDAATITVLILAAAIILITIIASIVTIANSGTRPDVTTKPPELTFPDVSDVPQRDEIKIQLGELSKEDTHQKDGIEYIYSFISYPKIEGGIEDATNKINSVLSEFASERVTIKSYERDNAEEAYLRAQNEAIDFIQFEFLTTTESIYVKNGYISIVFRQVRTVGINEPGESITSLCFDLESGDEIDISAFMNVEPAVAEKFVYDVFEQHIKINPNQYYNDALDTLPEIVDLKSFYLSEKGVILFFNPGLITPSVKGVQEFTVPYEKIGYK